MYKATSSTLLLNVAIIVSQLLDMTRGYIIFLLVFSIGCSDSLKGKIDYRSDKKDCSGLNGDVAAVVINNEYSGMQKDSKSKSAYLINESIDKAYEFTVRQTEIINDTFVNNNMLKIKLSPGDEKWLGCTKYDNVIINTDSMIPPEKVSTVILTYTCTGQRLIINPKELDNN